MICFTYFTLIQSKQELNKSAQAACHQTKLDLYFMSAKIPPGQPPSSDKSSDPGQILTRRNTQPGLFLPAG